MVLYLGMYLTGESCALVFFASHVWLWSCFLWRSRVLGLVFFLLRCSQVLGLDLGFVFSWGLERGVGGFGYGFGFGFWGGEGEMEGRRVGS